MANISQEEEEKIREWQKRTGGGCKDYRPTTEELIKRGEAEVAHNLRVLREWKQIHS